LVVRRGLAEGTRGSWKISGNIIGPKGEWGAKINFKGGEKKKQLGGTA